MEISTDSTTSYDTHDFWLINPGEKICSISPDSETSNKKDKLGDVLLKQIKTCFKRIATALRNSDSFYLRGLSIKIQKRFSRKFKYPGMQPMNLSRDIISKYLKVFPNRFIIAEKSDGIRYFLIHFKNGLTLFVGGNLIGYRVELGIELSERLPIESEEGWKIDNIYDGELITEEESEDNYKRKYLIFDALMLDGEIIGANPYKERLEKLSSFFNSERIRTQLQNLSVNDTSSDIIGISLINYFTFDKINELISDIQKTKHHVDGIIINTDDYPYHVGTCSEILKWKPAHLNTVDFYVLKNNRYNIYFLYVYYEDKKDLKAVSTLLFQSKLEEKEFEMNYKKCKTKVIECYFDSDGMENLRTATEGRVDFDFIDRVLKDKKKKDKFGWKLLRFRDDREYPNYIEVYKEIFNVICQQIDLEDLLKKEPIPETDIPKKKSFKEDFCISELIRREYSKF